MKVQIGGYTIDKRRGKWIVTHPDKLGHIVVYGNGHIYQTEYAIPEWSNEEEMCIRYKGTLVFLSEVMCIDRHAPEWMHGFDGYTSDSFFSGLLLKWDSWEDGYKVYTFIA